MSDDAGQNARAIIGAMRFEAEKLAAQAEQATSSEISREGKRFDAKWQAIVRAGTQIDVGHLLRDDDLVDFLSLHSEQMNGLITNLSTDVMQRIERETLSAIFENRSNADIAASLMEVAGIGRNRAKLIARDQASKLNNGMNEFRQRQAGITHYQWLGFNDGRERPTHVANNNKIFAWDNPSPITGHPGHDIKCRCRPKAVITEEPDDLPEAADNGKLSDFFQQNLPEIRDVAPVASQPVFGFADDLLRQRYRQAVNLAGAVDTAKASQAFTADDAERLVVEIYGHKLSDDDLNGLIGSNFRALLAPRRTKLINAVMQRLDLITNLLRHAATSKGIDLSKK